MRGDKCPIIYHQKKMALMLVLIKTEVCKKGFTIFDSLRKDEIVLRAISIIAPINKIDNTRNYRLI